MVFTRSPTHTWAQPTLVQCSYNMQSLSLGSKLLSVNPSSVENTLLQTEEVCVSLRRSHFSGRVRGLFTAERKPDALPRRFIAAHMTEACFLLALSSSLAALPLTPPFPSIIPSLPPLLFLPSFGNAPFKYACLSCCRNTEK